MLFAAFLVLGPAFQVYFSAFVFGLSLHKLPWNKL